MQTLEHRVSALAKANRRWQAGFVAAAAIALAATVAIYEAQHASGALPKQTDQGGELAELRKRVETLEKLLEGVSRDKDGALRLEKLLVTDGGSETVTIHGDHIAISDQTRKPSLVTRLDARTVVVSNSADVAQLSEMFEQMQRRPPTGIAVLHAEGFLIMRRTPESLLHGGAEAATDISPGAIHVFGDEANNSVHLDADERGASVSVMRQDAKNPCHILIGARISESPGVSIYRDGKQRAAMTMQPNGVAGFLDSSQIDTAQR